MIELRTLGLLDLRDAAGTEIRSVLQQPKRLALLAFLTIAAPHRYHRRDTLFAMFWPESDEEHARAALRRSLHFLRSGLGAATIEGRGEEEICVRADQLWCDAVACDEALRSSNLTAALELYCGDLLEGFHVSDAPGFQDWLDRERGRLRDSVARAAWSLAEAAERAHKGEEAGRWGRRALELTPEDEGARNRLLRLLDHIGDRYGAVHAYEDFAHHVAVESDVEPAPGTRDPADRWQSADEVVQRLEAITEPSKATGPTTAIRAPPRRRWWLLLAGAAIAVALALSAIVLRRSGAGTPLDPNLLAVAPFDAVGGELELWREGLVDLLSRNFDGAGSLRTVSPSVVIHRWNGRAEPVSAVKLGRRTGAGLIVFGNLGAVGPDSVRLAATILDVARGRTIGEAQVRGHADRMAQLGDSLTIGLLRELGQTRDVLAVRTASLPTTSLPALKAFLEGERLYRRAAWDSAQAAYRRALAHDSTFVPAMRHLAWSFGWRSAGSAESGPYYLRAGELNHGLPRRDSLLVVADSLNAALSTSLYLPAQYLPAASRWSLRERLFATLEEGARLYPEDPEIWYVLAEARYHHGWEKRVSRVQMLEAFERSIALDSSFTPAYEHAKTLGLALHGLEGWYRYARPYLRHPATDDYGGARLMNAIFEANPSLAAHTESVISTATRDQLFGAILHSWDFPDSGETTVRLGRALLVAGGHSSGHPEHAAMRVQTLVAALANRGHLREALTLIEQGVTLGVIPSVPAGIVLLGSSAPESVDATFGRWLRRGSFWPPGEWPAGGPPGPMAWALSWWSARGDTLALAEYGRRADSAQRATPQPIWKENAQYLAEAARAYLVLARGDTAAALRFFQRPNDFVFPWVRVTEAEILSRMGRGAEALQLFEEAYPLLWFWGPTRVLAKLEAARAAERLGQKKRAAAHYQFVVDVWRHADPELEPYVREARVGLQRLMAEPRR
jgi:DNA-binding SARP family transcriptional activator